MTVAATPRVPRHVSAVCCPSTAAQGQADAAAAPFAQGQVLVRFKATAAGARAASAQPSSPLPGLQLQRYAGRHHATRVVVSPPGAPGDAVGAAAAAPASAVILFEITDGSSVAAKVAELKQVRLSCTLSLFLFVAPVSWTLPGAGLHCCFLHRSARVASAHTAAAMPASPLLPLPPLCSRRRG